MMAEELNVDRNTVSYISTTLMGMKEGSVVPQILSGDQKQWQLESILISHVQWLKENIFLYSYHG
jgi:hypothetical protein